MEKLKGQISVDYYKECCEFIERVREYRHETTLERHPSKFEWLCQKTRGDQSNISGCLNQQHHTCMAQIAALTSDAHTCMAQRTALTSDALTSPTLPVTSTASTETVTTITTTTTVQSNKWVKNLLEVPLTGTQVSLLVHGPNFAVAPRRPPYGEYITTVDQACLNLEPHNAEEWRAEIRGAFNICTQL